MNADQTCPTCGRPLRDDALDGMCPRCLLHVSLGPIVNEQATPDCSAGQPGQLIGRYKLLQEIGEGGCGIVYMAQQEEPLRRQIALKVIKLGMDTRQVIARFEAERQALAMMDHPNIAKVLDAGPTENGRPYFVMELVRGIKLTDYCDQNNLSTKQRLELFLQVCKAIQHAHQKGIIHRDIKPSNILVTLHDGVAVPKVIDFGIAKATQGRLTDQTLFTAFEQFLGTPAYMSPEQAEMSGLDIDTRSDIYSLGVLLYELLTGQTPFDTKELLALGLDELRRTIREREPARPSTRLSTMGAALTTVAQHRQVEPGKLASLIQGDLDWVVMKALEKDRARRYETANGLAMDVERYLRTEPVMARPASQWYLLGKLVRRNKLVFGAAGAVLLALALGLSLSTALFLKERSTRRRAEAAENEQKRLGQEAQAKAEKEAELHERADANEKKARSEAAKSQQVARFLTDMLKSVEPSVALGRDGAMLREILDRTRERVGNDLRGQPEVQSELWTIIGTTYYGLGDFQKAEALHRDALRLRRALFGETNQLVAASLSALAEVVDEMTLGDHYDPDSAESMKRQALAILRTIYGNLHVEVARSLNSLGDVLYRRALSDGASRERRLSEAESLQREALAIQTNLLGRVHADTQASLTSLADVLNVQGKWDQAETLYGEALAIQRTLWGDAHPEMATTLLRLGGVLRAHGQLDQAEALSRQGVSMRKKLLGNEHPYVASALDAFSSLLREQGKLEEAETCYREHLMLRRKLHAHDTPKIVPALDRLADVLREQRKYSEAEPFLREALAIQREFLPTNTLETLATLQKLAWVLQKQNKLAEVEELARERRVMRQHELARAIPARDPNTSTNLIDLSSFYTASLAENWHGPGSSDLSELPTGMQTLVGVQFDVRGLVQLAVENPPYTRYPDHVSGIGVNHFCRRLHFLHSAIYARAASSGAQIGTYVVHYASGKQLEIPIIIGRSVADWFTQPNEQGMAFTIAWSGYNAESRRQGRTIRLFKSTWENPAPTELVTTIDFLCSQSAPAPFLVALTAD